MWKIRISIITLIFVFTEIQSAKILGVFPTPSISHQVVFRQLMIELARRGHEITVITTDLAFSKGQAPQNITEIDVHDISYQLWLQFFAEKVNEKDRILSFGLISDLLLEIFVKQLKSSEIQKLLNRNENFDLIFVESCVRPALIFSYLYNAPVIEFSSVSGILLAFEMVGAASHPLIYPNVLHRRIYNLTLWEKITELYIHYSQEHILLQQINKENEIMRTIFGSDAPNLDDLRQNVQMLFLNVHPIWDFNRPVPPNVLYLGGLHQGTQHELSADLKLYLDSSKNGVIYASFGTNIKPSMIPPDKLKIFTDVFSQLTYDVLFKWDNDELPGRSKNVKISKWLPQSDLLRHPKVKLFITQGGLQSTDEALTAGVPLIGVPMFGDQWYNTEQYVKFNIGKQLLIETLTKEQLLDDIKTVINDKSYQENIVKLLRFMNDQPNTSLERAVWWTEHVLRHSQVAYRRTPAANIQWTEYYEVEIVLLALSAFHSYPFLINVKLNMLKKLLDIVCLIFVLTESETAKILGVFPTPSISHQVVFRPLILELVNRGHEVTVITTDPAFPKGQAPQNLTEIDVHDISYEMWKAFGLRGNEKDPIEFYHFASDLLLNLIIKQLKSDEIQKLLRKKEKFDLLFIESWTRSAIVYSHIYNAPVIEISSFSGILSAYEAIGAASHPLIYPNALQKRIYNLTLWEKITELYYYHATNYVLVKHEQTANKILKSILGSDLPDLNDLRQNVRMMFVNVHPIWDFNRPVPPNVLYLGSLHQKPQHELPEDLKLYLDSSKNGVIYISFGTNVKPSMFLPETLAIFNNVFSQLPYDFLWKWDKDELPGIPKNVKISKWLPQSDLLRHPKVKLFITQGGLQSTDEAMSAGVPLIGIPILADQWFNVEQYVKFHIGKGLSIETLTEEQLMNAIKSVIDDKSYRRNIVKLRNFMDDQPQSSLERAVWWTEHVIRHGEVEYRRTPAANIPWIEYYEIKIVLLLLTALITLVSVTVLPKLLHQLSVSRSRG
ncbi:UDP-glucosyltransferase 2-like [Vanessa atalanta]|uniref:UDP-glucosyltransferase 2-like n=1 Tax=Vanessa atalanta TaxID=42275 RepID=UPI001FCD7208|nr:UDP-glucosyltransferase 2-like [Vanessa atalanta]